MGGAGWILVLGVWCADFGADFGARCVVFGLAFGARCAKFLIGDTSSKSCFSLSS